MATIVVTYFRQNTDKYSTASAGDRQVSVRDRGMAIERQEEQSPVAKIRLTSRSMVNLDNQ
jgi:hypothetical protein